VKRTLHFKTQWKPSVDPPLNIQTFKTTLKLIKEGGFDGVAGWDMPVYIDFPKAVARAENMGGYREIETFLLRRVNENVGGDMRCEARAQTQGYVYHSERRVSNNVVREHRPEGGAQQSD
jgi:hypothetical protein